MTKASKEHRRARMSDVARLAGVGTMTVSRFLSGATNVKKDACERIRWAIERLDYKPNESARALRAQKAKTIGVIVPHLGDQFFAECCYAIDEVARRFGYSVIVTSSNSQLASEKAEAQQMVQRHVGGIIVIPADSQADYLTFPEFADVPIVSIDRPIEKGEIDAVLVENKLGARIAVEHLLGHGHTSISFLGVRKDLYTMGTRYQGYRQAMTKAGLKPEPYVDCAKTEIVADAIRELLQRPVPPTAIIAGSNRVTMGLLFTVNALKLQIPSDLAIVCFDHLDMSDLWNPPLTAVRQPVREIGRVAAEMLFRRIVTNTKSEKAEHVLLPVEFVIRKSCGCN